MIKIDIEKQELNLLRNGFLDTIKKYYKNYVILIEFLISNTDNSINEEFCKYFLKIIQLFYLVLTIGKTITAK